MYKTLDDVHRVIGLKKSDSVIDKFVASYLLGVALQPYFDAEDEYTTLLNTEDKDTKEAIYNEDTQEVLVAAIDYNQIRDDRIAEMVQQHPYLVEPEVGYTEVTTTVFTDGVETSTTELVGLPVASIGERRPNVTVEPTAWRVQNYSVLRKREYPDYVEFFDAWVQDDKERLDKYKDDCLKVKLKYPKE